MKKVKISTMSSFSLSSLPREIVVTVASFMEPLDLYMCKQTCRVLSEMDRGHAMRDPTLSMVGTHYKLYNLCSCCQEELCDNPVICSGMVLHKSCQRNMNRSVRKFVQTPGGWMQDGSLIIGAGLYNNFYAKWYPSLWDFHDYVELCKYSVDVGEVVQFFKLRSLRSYFEKNYTRHVQVGRDKINVLNAYLENGGKWVMDGGDMVARLDEFAEDIQMRYCRAEELFRDHSRVRNSSFGDFYEEKHYSKIFEEELDTVRFVAAVKEYDMGCIERILIRVSVKCMCEHLMECECRLCCHFYKYLVMSGFADLTPRDPYLYHISDGIVGRIYIQGVETCVSMVEDNLKLILNCSRGLVHNNPKLCHMSYNHDLRFNKIDNYITEQLQLNEDMWLIVNGAERVQSDLERYITNFNNQ